MASIHDLANKWLAQDRDPETRREIANLIDVDNVMELESRLRHRITFGTAGLRAAMKAGFAYMNTLTVLQASDGLAQYILDQHHSDSKKQLTVVIGHDARHNSERFARLAAAAFLQKEFTILWYDQLVHTPMVPFAVDQYGAAAGVMVTASHNPKNDNGYKVYWGNGCQIIPPHDTGIARSIEAVKDVKSWNDSLVDGDSHVKRIFPEATSAYFKALNALARPLSSGSTPLNFVYTPMHGVGLPFMEQLASLFADTVSMQVVDAQAAPDPDFPSVPFPNPEEKGALTLAIQEADMHDCSLILANDPDADRFAVAERLENGTWHQFTGNQMGVLLASFVMQTYTGDTSKLAMLASAVSSRMLAVIAEKEGFHFQETLTGFKWLGNIAQELRKHGYEPAYAYEEAIGYMFPTVVWDKDGVAAATVFLKACLRWQQRGLTPYATLQDLYKKYGYFEDSNTYLISPSPDTTNRVFNDIRALNAGSRPQTLGKRKISRWRDLTLGFDSGTADGKPELPIDASAQMITCEMDGVVFTARGSGTEPKIKLYIEAQSQTSGEARATADAVLRDLLKEWFRSEYGLKLAGT